MPGVNPPTEQWLARKIAQMEADIRALKNQRTQYVVNPATSDAQSIIGDISRDPAGNATGLSGFGIAVWNGARWASAAGVAVGFADCVGNGTTESNSVTVPHPLGAVPSAVSATVIGGAFGNVLCPRWDNAASTGTDLVFRVESNAAFGFTVGLSWVAFL